MCVCMLDALGCRISVPLAADGVLSAGEPGGVGQSGGRPGVHQHEAEVEHHEVGDSICGSIFAINC
jgi:hypothetical protein